MKKILRYLWMDKPSTGILIITIVLFVCSIVFNFNVRFFLPLIMIFVFRGIMWQGQYVDKISMLEKWIENRV
jgi:hypothetical protein